MRLDEQARVSRDQMQINRVQQAVVTVGLERWRRQPRDPATKARRIICLLAALGDEWVTDDEALLNGVRGLWRR